MSIGETIEYQHRRTPGMTQEDLADKIGIRAQTYRNKIAGKSPFKVEEAMAVAEALGLTVEQLLASPRIGFDRIWSEIFMGQEIRYLRKCYENEQAATGITRSCLFSFNPP